MKLDKLKQIATPSQKNKQYRTLPVERPRALSVEPPPATNTPPAATNTTPAAPAANGRMDPTVTPLPNQLVTPAAPELPADATTPIDIANSHPISVTGTVDQLALANNLFAQNDIENAKNMYEKLLKLPQTAQDIVWIQYQLAGCYRRAGNNQLAKKYYRTVVSNKQEAYWSNRAMWWMDYLNRSSTMMEKQQQLEAELKSLQQELDATRSN